MANKLFFLLFIIPTLLLAGCNTQAPSSNITNNTLVAPEVVSNTTPIQNVPLTIYIMNASYGNMFVVKSPSSIVIINSGGNNLVDNYNYLLNNISSPGLDYYIVAQNMMTTNIKGLPLILGHVKTDLGARSVTVIDNGVDDSNSIDFLDYKKFRDTLPYHEVGSTGMEIISIDNQWLMFLNQAQIPFSTGEQKESSVAVSFARITGNGAHLLFPGDIGGAAESYFMQNAHLSGGDFYVLPNHGSLSSNGQEFYVYAQPKVVVLSVGDNVFGLPDNTTVSMVGNSNALFYRTDINGTLVFDCDKTCIIR